MRAIYAKALRFLKSTGPSILSVLTSAVLWLLAFFFSGLSLIVAAIRLLAGDGWAMLAAGIFLVALSSILRKGMTNG